jgi:hypothetical protein
MSTINNYMSWEGGVDLVAVTQAGLAMPNVIIHVARMVHTPAGSAPSGMILYQPDPAGAPAVIGFISQDAQVGAYFGPKIFAGTPFEQAPVLAAEITVETGAGRASSRVKVGDHLFEVEMTALGALESIHRDAGGMTPFTQDVIEAMAGSVSLKVNGAAVPLILPPVGISGGAPAVFAPAGIYARA